MDGSKLAKLNEDDRVQVVPKKDNYFEGRVEVATKQALIVRPKGKTSTLFFEADDLDDVVLIPEGPKPLVSVNLKMCPKGEARSHLLQRHGMTLREVNDLTDEGAFDLHEKIDHGPLGHSHVPSKPRN